MLFGPRRLMLPDEEEQRRGEGWVGGDVGSQRNPTKLPCVSATISASCLFVLDADRMCGANILSQRERQGMAWSAKVLFEWNARRASSFARRQAEEMDASRVVSA